MTERTYSELMKDEQNKNKFASMINECGKPIPELARESGVQNIKVYQISMGEKPSYLAATKLCDALNITLEELLGQN